MYIPVVSKDETCALEEKDSEAIQGKSQEISKDKSPESSRTKMLSQKNMKDVQVQTSPKRFAPSPEKIVLRREVYVLQKKLRQRDAKLHTMNIMLKRLREVYNEKCKKKFSESNRSNKSH